MFRRPHAAPRLTAYLKDMLSSPLDQQLARSGRLRRILFAEGHRISTPVPPPLLKVLERR
jgi:hypothetical protein